MVVSKLHSIPSKGVVLIMAAENPRKAQAVERKNISVKIFMRFLFSIDSMLCLYCRKTEKLMQV